MSPNEITPVYDRADGSFLSDLHVWRGISCPQRRQLIIISVSHTVDGDAWISGLGLVRDGDPFRVVLDGVMELVAVEVNKTMTVSQCQRGNEGATAVQSLLGLGRGNRGRGRAMRPMSEALSSFHMCQMMEEETCWEVEAE